MAESRFVSFSEEKIGSFLDSNENRNTARKTKNNLELFKAFLKEKVIRFKTRKNSTRNVGQSPKTVRSRREKKREARTSRRLFAALSQCVINKL
jgi:hypothetical protein